MRLTLNTALLAMLLPSAALADNLQFAKYRDHAKPVEGLTAFLDRYIGSCDDPTERQACMANVNKNRGEMNKNTYYLILDDQAAPMMKPAGFNPATREFRIDLTPFFEGGGRALTDGAPKGQDPQGRPRIPLMPLTAKVPDDWMPMDMERLLRTGSVRVHIVFKPDGIWQLPAKDGSKLEGVKAKFIAVRLTNRRTGDEIAMRIRE